MQIVVKKEGKKNRDWPLFTVRKFYEQKPIKNANDARDMV